MTQSGDSPWKEIIEQLLEEFLQLLFPDLEDRIIWSNGHKFYDKELDKLWEDTGCASVVKLVKVQIQSKDQWLLLHFVTQVPANELVGGEHYYEAFEDGVFMNHLRVRSHYKQPVTSVAVLGVNNLGWRPLPYKEEEFDCWLHFGFPVRGTRTKPQSGSVCNIGAFAGTGNQKLSPPTQAGEVGIVAIAAKEELSS